MLRVIGLVLGFMVLSGIATANVLGLWATPEEKSHVKIDKCGEKLCGSIVWLKEPMTKAGKPKIDTNNEDEKLQSRAILGLPLLNEFVKTDDPNVWEDGEIYNPEDGKLYSCVLTLEDDGRLKVRGYVGLPLFGKTQYWTKVKE